MINSFYSQSYTHTPFCIIRRDILCKTTAKLVNFKKSAKEKPKNHKLFLSF